jgi:DNA repair exonuclease SbcCD nuclease subunit
MTKFIVLSDVHIRSTTPPARNDADFLWTCLATLEFVFELAEKEQADAILQCGDLFDAPNQSARVLIKLAELINCYNIPFVTTVGNHDVPGDATNRWNTDSALGVLASSMPDKFIVLRQGDGMAFENCSVHGFGVKEVETERLLAGKWVPDSQKKEFRIGIIHANVGAKKSDFWRGVKELGHCLFWRYSFWLGRRG